MVILGYSLCSNYQLMLTVCPIKDSSTNIHITQPLSTVCWEAFSGAREIAQRWRICSAYSRPRFDPRHSMIYKQPPPWRKKKKKTLKIHRLTSLTMFTLNSVNRAEEIVHRAYFVRSGFSPWLHLVPKHCKHGPKTRNNKLSKSTYLFISASS